MKLILLVLALIAGVAAYIADGLKGRD